MIKKIIEKVTAGLPIKCKDFVPVWRATADTTIPLVDDASEEDSTRKKSSTRTKASMKTKKEKQATLEPSTITVSGEVFFTDPNLTVHRIVKNNNDREIYDGYAVLTVKNLMTRTQKNEMNPLVVNIKKVVKLPVNVMAKNGCVYLV